jgi:tetratricopeptide (TPR) repeat protein
MQRAVVVAAILLAGAGAYAQVRAERERARPFFRTAQGLMRSEQYPEAAKSFQQAIDVDHEFEDAYYGLGLANMRMRKYAEALISYTKCRDLYQAMAGKQFSSKQDAQRYRQDRLTEIDESIRTYQSGPQNVQSQDRVRQLQQQRREIQDYISRGSDMSISNTIPSFVSLALGSAYFRLQQWAEAEREYKAAIATDPKSGEAYNNLAVVYLQTGRFKEADDAVKSAEKAGFNVHPQLKQDIKAKLG